MIKGCVLAILRLKRQPAVNKQKQEPTGVPAVRECHNQPQRNPTEAAFEAVARLSFFYSRHCAIVDSLNEPETA